MVNDALVDDPPSLAAAEKHGMKPQHFFLAAAVTFGGADLALAQSAPSAVSPAPAAAVPERTTASYGDWTLRCERSSTMAQSLRICEITQAIQLQGQQGTIAQLAIGRIQKTDPWRLTVVLPPNVALRIPPKVAIEKPTRVAFTTIWQRCLPGGCFADAALTEENLKTWRARTEPGAIEFQDGAARDLALPFSNRGLSQALDALAKE